MVTDSEDLSEPPRRVDIARWIADAERNMKRSTMVNAWMRHDFEYFPRASPVIDVPPVVVTAAEDVTEISDMDDDGGGNDGGDDGTGNDAGAVVSVV